MRVDETGNVRDKESYKSEGLLVRRVQNSKIKRRYSINIVNIIRTRKYMQLKLKSNMLDCVSI